MKSTPDFRLCLMGVLLLLRASAASAADAPPTQPAQDLSAFILTPPAPAKPRINGPGVYGERAGRPFLYTIPATGDRPISFSADGLLAGLTLDSHSGRITGSMAGDGSFDTTIHATNAQGAADRKFRIVIGELIALTPPMGWNSWNCWAGAVDQQRVLQSARAMVSSGLINHGWTYINIDDTWQGRRSADTHALQPDLKKFPDMRGMCDEIHGMGLKTGIYSTPWVISYAGHLGGSAENPNGDRQDWPKNVPANKKILPKAVGKYSFARPDARQWADWGIDYLKYDWNPIEVPQVREMSDALHGSGRDIVYSLSNQASIELGADYARLANCWRTTGDIRDTWQSLTRNGFVQDPWRAFAKPGHYNDPDMLVVGYVGWGPKLHPSRLTPDEQYTHMTLWSLLSAPLLIGCDLDRLDPFTLNLLENDEVLAVDQDSLAKQAIRVSLSRTAFLYVKELEDGSTAVGLFNVGNGPQKISASWMNLKLNGSQSVRDLWRQKDLGTVSDRFDAQVNPHGAMLVKFTAAN